MTQLPHSTESMIKVLDEAISNKNLSSKLKKAINSFKKNISKMSAYEFRKFMFVIVDYLTRIMSNEDNLEYTEISLLLETVDSMNEPSDTEDDDEDAIPMGPLPMTRVMRAPVMQVPTTQNVARDLKPITNPQEQSPTARMNIRLPGSLKGIKWLEKEGFELTSTADGVLYVNHLMWEYMKEDAKRSYVRPQPMMPVLAIGMPDMSDNNKDEKISLSYNMAYNDDGSLLMVLKTIPSSLMDVTFYECKDNNGRTYGTTGEYDTVGMASKFKINGVYKFRSTNLNGILIGEQIKSFDTGYVVDKSGVRKVICDG